MRSQAVSLAAVFLAGVVGFSVSSAEVNPDAIVASWLFDEGGGGVAADSSGNGYDADLHGNPAWVVGRHGSALEFDGGSYLEVRGSRENLSFGGAAPFSIVAWVKNQGGGTIVSKFNGGIVGAYILSIGGGGLVTFHREVAPWSYSGSRALPSNEFGHVAVTYDGDVMRIYVNGDLDAEQDRGPQNTDTVTPVLIGAQLTGGTPSGFFMGVLDEVALFDVALTAAEISDAMKGLTPSKATSPSPQDGAVDVPRDTNLSWKAAVPAATHDVYFGTNRDDVNAAGTGAPLDVLVSRGQMETTYAPPDVLTYGATYFWRIDEVNGAPDYTVFKGNVWSFTVEPFAYPIRNIMAASNATSSEGQGPENTVNGSGLDADDEHSVESTDMWLGGPGDEAVYIQYQFDGIYKLHEMLVWNYNVQFEPILGFGLKDVTIAYSEDGEDWTALGDVEFAKATAKTTYTANTIVDFKGKVARFVRLHVHSNWGTMSQYGLSEVRFLFIPTQAREPQPPDGQSDVDVNAALSWRMGREATSHEVYFGASPDELPLVALLDRAVFTPGAMGFGTTYYWRVDEVIDATWAGNLWNFTTREYALIEDFESYTDNIEAGEAIFDTWLDGWVNNTGSTVGYLDAPFAERTIVHSGRQSMPLQYDNSIAPFYSEAERIFDAPQDWTAGAADSLRLHFRGDETNSAQTLYAMVRDSSGQTATVSHTDAETLLLTEWQQWRIPYSDLGDVDLSRVSAMVIGVGSRASPAAGGAGIVYIDDIDYGKPVATE